MHLSTNSTVNLGFLPNFNYQVYGRMADLSETYTKPEIVANSITKDMNDRNILDWTVHSDAVRCTKDRTTAVSK